MKNKRKNRLIHKMIQRNRSSSMDNNRNCTQLYLLISTCRCLSTKNWLLQYCMLYCLSLHAFSSFRS